MEKWWDQPKSPDPGSQENPPHRARTQQQPEESNNAVLGLSFPRKLWIILEDAAFTSVHRNDEADMGVTEADLFQTEDLQHRGMDRIFKTASEVSSTN